MSDWEVIDKSRAHGTDLAMNIASLGVYSLSGAETFRYTIRNIETGEEKTVLSEDRYELGERIAAGDFDDD